MASRADDKCLRCNTEVIQPLHYTKLDVLTFGDIICVNCWTDGDDKQDFVKFEYNVLGEYANNNNR